MKLTEETKIILCNRITESLNQAKLKDGYPLVDALTMGEIIVEGQEQIDNIVEQIYFDMNNWDIKSIVVQI